MTITLFVFSIFTLATIRRKKDENFLSISQTRAINGIMSALIFISHFSQFIPAKEKGEIYSIFLERSGQLVVVSFLGFSGYGIMLSILKKKKPYVISLIKKRFLNIWLKFAIIIILFIIVNLMIGKTFTIEHMLLSFTGWESVGNSNWYIMAILVMYIITFISFVALPPDKYKFGILLVFLFSAVYITAMVYAGKPGRFYNTIISYPVGMLLAFYKDNIISLLNRKKVYIITSVIAVVGFSVLVVYREDNITFQFLELFFLLLMVLFSFKLSFKSKILEWLGEYAFELFLLGRIPFIILRRYDLNLYVFFFVSLIITIVISYGFRKLFDLSGKAIMNVCGKHKIQEK